MDNPMREIRIEKVTINIGVGGEAEKLERAAKLLTTFSNQTVFRTKSKTRSTFNVPKGRHIGAKITLRGENAEKFLQDALRAVNHNVRVTSFDRNGNFAFGVHEHIDLPNVRYDPKIGIFGFDVCVTLTRPGYRVKKKKLSSRVGHTHAITREEGIEFAKQKLGIKITEE